MFQRELKAMGCSGAVPLEFSFSVLSGQQNLGGDHTSAWLWCIPIVFDLTIPVAQVPGMRLSGNMMKLTLPMHTGLICTLKATIRRSYVFSADVFLLPFGLRERKKCRKKVFFSKKPRSSILLPCWDESVSLHRISELEGGPEVIQSLPHLEMDKARCRHKLLIKVCAAREW